MILYVVHNTVGGYAREDAARSIIDGAYTDADTARKISLITGGTVEPVEVDYIPLGYEQAMHRLGIKL